MLPILAASGVCGVPYYLNSKRSILTNYSYCSFLFKLTSFRLKARGKPDYIGIRTKRNQFTVKGAIPFKIYRVALVNKLTPAGVNENLEVIDKVIREHREGIVWRRAARCKSIGSNNLRIATFNNGYRIGANTTNGGSHSYDILSRAFHRKCSSSLGVRLTVAGPFVSFKAS